MQPQRFTEDQLKDAKDRIRGYRTSWWERASDGLELLWSPIVEKKAVFLSLEPVLCAKTLVSRLFFVADLGTDIQVGLALLAADDLWWAVICFAIILQTYLILLVALRHKAVEQLQKKLRLEGHDCLMHLLWMILGIPLLMAVDVAMVCRYALSDPMLVQHFHYLKLRGIVEAVESFLQCLLQGYITLRVLNPGKLFPEVSGRVDPAVLALSLSFSLLNLMEQYSFVNRFSDLQTHGRKGVFLRKMADLGADLAPSSPYDAIAKQQRVVYPFLLKQLRVEELLTIARCIKSSRVLQEIHFLQADFLDGYVQLFWDWRRELLSSRSLKKAQFTYCESKSRDFWYEHLQAVAGCMSCLQEIDVHGKDPILLSKQDPLRHAALSDHWTRLRDMLLEIQVQQVQTPLEFRQLFGALLSLANFPDMFKAVGLVDTFFNFDPMRVHFRFSALELACKGNAPKTVQLLLKRRADPSEFQGCVPGSDQPLAMAAVSGLAMAAVSGNSEQCLKLLLEHPSYRETIQSLESLGNLLIACAQLNHGACMQVLLQNKADPNFETDSPPLIEAAKENRTEMIRNLLRARANPNCRQRFYVPQDGTPLMYAVLCDSVEGTRLLLQARADPLLRNAEGQDAVELAEPQPLQVLKWHRDKTRPSNKPDTE